MTDEPATPRGEDGKPDIDRVIRMNELTERARELGIPEFSTSEDCPPEIAEQFLNNIVAYESAPLVAASDTLEEQGIQLPKPEELSDIEVHRKLWQIIRALAEGNTFILSTDHLSDRELYTYLWVDVLRERNPVMPKGSGWIHCLDLVSSGSDEDVELWLRFYADEATRDRWAKDFPDVEMPPREKPPYDRDRLLPKAPPPEPMSDDEFSEAYDLDSEADMEAEPEPDPLPDPQRDQDSDDDATRA